MRKNAFEMREYVTSRAEEIAPELIINPDGEYLSDATSDVLAKHLGKMFAEKILERAAYFSFRGEPPNENDLKRAYRDIMTNESKKLYLAAVVSSGLAQHLCEIRSLRDIPQDDIKGLARIAVSFREGEEASHLKLLQKHGLEDEARKMLQNLNELRKLAGQEPLAYEF